MMTMIMMKGSRRVQSQALQFPRLQRSGLGRRMGGSRGKGHGASDVLPHAPGQAEGRCGALKRSTGGRVGLIGSPWLLRAPPSVHLTNLVQ